MKLLATGFGLALLGFARPVEAACNDTDPCTGGPLRVMLVLDGASALLNDANGPAAMGESTWDRLRIALADDPGSIFDGVVDPPGIVLSQIAHVGLLTFGDPGQALVVVDYGPCTRPNLDWALDPNTSCDAPGCDDPWGGPPIEWTSKDGSTIDPPDFAQPTFSTMPHCDGAGSCSGSGRAVHTGIELATANQSDYRAQTDYTHDDSTQYINILVVAGEYDGASDDVQVQQALETAYADGTVTYVIGFADVGPGMNQLQAQLDDMAAWGSADSETARIVADEAGLREAARDIVGALPLPCCYTIDCSAVGGADSGGIGNDGGADGAADGAEWGSLDGEGSASGGTGGSGASADGSSGAGAEAGFDDDGGCRCGVERAASGWWAVVAIAIRRRRRAHP